MCLDEIFIFRNSFSTHKTRRRIHLYRRAKAVPRAHDSLVTSIIHMYKIKKERGEALVCWDSRPAVYKVGGSVLATTSEEILHQFVEWNWT
jgi:hypothetical protein